MMKEMVVPAQYLQIALDVAGRIAHGELQEGSRLYGRSVMASEYSVSPETIRRALRLLADMKVVEVRPQSGAVVLSRDSAWRYLENFSGNADTQALRSKMKDLMEQYTQLNHQMGEVVSALVKSRETFAMAREPLPNYEIPIPTDSPLLGRSVRELQFWQNTGGTIAAIRRGQTVILSPGPYAELYVGDVIVMVGTPSAVEAAKHFVIGKESAP